MMPKTTGKKVIAGAKAGKAYKDLPVTREYRPVNAVTGLEKNREGTVIGKMDKTGKIRPVRTNLQKAAQLKRTKSRGS